MPPLTRWYIRTSLVYFVAALFVGVALMLRLTMDLPPFVAALQPTYFHLLMLGWVAQLIFGVAFWMFPKASASKPRGSGSAAAIGSCRSSIPGLAPRVR